MAYLVTGAMGCIGAWTIYHLVKRGELVISFDLSETRHRLDMLLSADEQAGVTFVRGDLTDSAQVLDTIQKHNITHILHLAALQVPFVRANPVRGAQVNVVGTINVFEAARQVGLKHVTYASSVAVYGPPDDYPLGAIAHDAPFAPRTLYGVFKQDNEMSARIYWQDHQISSTALRPHTVYGIGRDQGVTSDPTKLMLAAALGKPFQAAFSSRVQLQLASDVALQFIEAADIPLNGAYGFNLGGEALTVPEIIEIINSLKPDAELSCVERTLPFPESCDDSALKQQFTRVYSTPVREGIRQTMEHFERCAREERFVQVLTL